MSLLEQPQAELDGRTDFNKIMDMSFFEQTGLLMDCWSEEFGDKE